MLLNILIIDDDKDFLEALEMALYDIYEEIEITKALSGESGLEYIRANGFHQILLDLIMEGINGVEVLSEIKKMGKKYHIILMSAFADDKIIEKTKHTRFMSPPGNIVIDEVILPEKPEDSAFRFRRQL